MKRPLSIVMILAALLGGVSHAQAAASAAAIVHPPDMALLLGSGSLDLLGWNGGTEVLAVAVKNAEGSREYKGGAGAFTVKIALSPGINTIEYGGRTVRVFLAGPGEKAPAAFSLPDPHAVDNACDDCHAFAAGAAPLQEAPPGLCGRCHDDMLKDKTDKPHAVPHPPAADGDCLACHAFHRRSIKHLPAEAKRALCFGCHDDFTGGGRKRLHAPVAQGDCTGCHGVHGGTEKALLPATGIKLCVLCHADPSKKKDGGDWAEAHPALDDGCAACHLPHTSENAGLLKQPQAQVCGECHDPFPTEDGGKGLTIHNPVEEGECAACHAVHGSDAKKLLAADGKALCERCHTDPSTNGGAEWATPHPALDDGCLACHKPHVAPAAGMLKKAQAPLCFDCHDAFAAPPEGGSLHRPVIQGQCARCHAPHGSAVAKLLVAPAAKELCLKCHKDPSLDPDGKKWLLPHPALDDGCPTCHQPHVAPAPRLLSKPQRELCADCHEDKNLNSEGSLWNSPHVPVESGLCNSCHGVHGASGMEALLLKLKSSEVCTANCHSEVHEKHRSVNIDLLGDEVVNYMVRIPEGFPVDLEYGTLDCIGCHQPHGSDNPMMWNQAEQTFCIQCHRF